MGPQHQPDDEHDEEDEEDERHQRRAALAVQTLTLALSTLVPTAVLDRHGSCFGCLCVAVIDEEEEEERRGGGGRSSGWSPRVYMLQLQRTRRSKSRRGLVRGGSGAVTTEY